MFEIPAVHRYDFEIYGSEAKTNAFFRSLEVEEIRQNHGDFNGVYKYVEPRTGDFVGLVTKGVYNERGELLTDLFSIFQEASGPKTNPRRLLKFNKQTEKFERQGLDDEDVGNQEFENQDSGNEDIEEEHDELDAHDNHNGQEENVYAADVSIELDKTRSKDGNGTDSFYSDILKKVSLFPRHFGREIVALNSGCVTLPRSTLRPLVYVDCDETKEIVKKSLSGSANDMSPAARSILMRSNYRVPFGLQYNLVDDEWSKMHMRRRSLHVVTSILYLSMERRDYERAWMALTCLLRGNHVDVRLVWMPALELLAWRHDLFPQKTKSPQNLLSWLIAMNPRMPKTRHNMHRYIPKANDLMPVSILLKLVNDEFHEAMEEAAQAVKSLQHSSDPFCWALVGLARLLNAHQFAPKTKINADSTEVRHIQHDFVRCLDLGGALPNRIRRLAVGLGSPSEDIKEKLLDGLDEESSEEEIDSDSSDDARDKESDESDNDESDNDESDSDESDGDHKNTEHNYIGREGSRKINGKDEEPDILAAEANLDSDDDDDVDEERTTDASSDDDNGDDNGEEDSEDNGSGKRLRDADETFSNSENSTKRPKMESSTQHFYSQAASLGAELGSSDSDDYI